MVDNFDRADSNESVEWTPLVGTWGIQSNKSYEPYEGDPPLSGVMTFLVPEGETVAENFVDDPSLRIEVCG
jgi:hypothetical protein